MEQLHLDVEKFFFKKNFFETKKTSSLQPLNKLTPVSTKGSFTFIQTAASTSTTPEFANLGVKQH